MNFPKFKCYVKPDVQGVPSYVVGKIHDVGEIHFGHTEKAILLEKNDNE